MSQRVEPLVLTRPTCRSDTRSRSRWRSLRVNVRLVQRASNAGRARANELAIGDVLEAVDVRWWSHTAYRVVYIVAAIETREGGKLTIRFTSENDCDRVLTVPPGRRFLPAIRD
ncbi:hypothetical protein ACVWZ7_001255 [Arthrobacter sp. TE12232]